MSPFPLSLSAEQALNSFHTCPKIWKSLFYYLLMCLKYYCMFGKQCRPWSDATFCDVLSWSTLFAESYLSQYLGLLWYFREQVQKILTESSFAKNLGNLPCFTNCYTPCSNIRNCLFIFVSTLTGVTMQCSAMIPRYMHVDLILAEWNFLWIRCISLYIWVISGKKGVLVQLHYWWPQSVLDWLQSPVTKYFFLIILINNPLKWNQK